VREVEHERDCRARPAKMSQHKILTRVLARLNWIFSWRTLRFSSTLASSASVWPKLDTLTARTSSPRAKRVHGDGHHRATSSSLPISSFATSIN